MLALVVARVLHERNVTLPAREHAEAALVRLSIEIANREIIIKQLVSMLSDSGSEAAQEQAAAALCDLAFGR